MYTPNQIADYFLSQIDTDKGDTISPLKLQKLVYYAQAWHFTVFKKPLFSEKIEAWRNGPVVPSLYKRFVSKYYKENAIRIGEEDLNVPEFPNDTKKLLEEVLSIYGERSGSYLEALTHKEEPWLIARGNKKPFESCSAEITLDSMSKYYSALRNVNTEAQAE